MSMLKQLPDMPIWINKKLTKPTPQPQEIRQNHQCIYPTITNTEETIKQFYAKLNSIMCKVPPSDKKLLGDFIVSLTGKQVQD